ncbi:DUF302 domain-containing protein [Vibrio sp. WXL103]|uniref:DUF302 domain-containing protein n=1 Tax=unclassified Vibrio TaxID=2614977 RepID=UPI003EC6BCB0
MTIRASLIAIALLTSLSATASSGLITLKSASDVATTADKLEQALLAKGMTVFARIDHGQAAQQVDVDLRPTQLVIFGNPKVGSPLMACSQTAGIDLPQKALIYQDQQGQVWLSYNDPTYLTTRHDINGCDAVLAKVEAALAGFAKVATSE